MLIDVEILTKPFTALRQFFMTDKPIVTKREERLDPRLILSGPEGVSYTVQMPDGKTREVFRFHDTGGRADFSVMHFVTPGAEGDNFYTTPRKDRFSREPVSDDVKKAAAAHEREVIATSTREFELKYGESPEGEKVREPLVRRAVSGHNCQ